ncbi:MAG: hypothetical protein V4550_21010 [Gemmatimonadota bacterium]
MASRRPARRAGGTSAPALSIPSAGCSINGLVIERRGAVSRIATDWSR